MATAKLLSDRGEWVITAGKRDGVLARMAEVWQYRRILWFFAARAVQTLYRRTRLGRTWMFIKTLLPLYVGSFVFGDVMNVDSGAVPYLVFYLAGQLAWNFFDGPLVRASRGIDSNRELLSKLYIPRIILPLGQIAAGLVEPVIITGVLIITLVYYRIAQGVWYVQPDLRMIAAIASLLLMLWCAFAVSLFTTVWQARARDVKFLLRYAVSFWLFLTPVVYPLSKVAPNHRWIIYLNPLTGPVETFKWAVLGATEHSWVWFAYSTCVTGLVFAIGLWYFTATEGSNMDRL
jgi:lipopolysaccharide transport system permease protein